MTGRTKRPRRSVEERAAESQALLTSAVASLAATDGFARWLDVRATFRSYSLQNTMLILTQFPDATMVAGYRAWQKLGRQVRKIEPGERRGIRIFAPSVKIVRDSEGAPVTNADGDEERALRFRLVSVFDVSQTEGDPLPDLGVGEATGNAEALRTTLEKVAVDAGLTVRVEETGSSAGGFYRPSEALIVLDAKAGHAEQTTTLAHELGHFFDPFLVENPGEYGQHRGDCEAVAEAVAYCTARAAGLDAENRSVGYVAAWTMGDATKVKELAERIDAALRPIFKAIDIDTEDE